MCRINRTIGDEEQQLDQNSQRETFCGIAHNPTFIICSIQTMHFIYAISFSILIVWRKEIDIMGTMLQTRYLFCVCGISYGGFIVVISFVLPAHTFCVSLEEILMPCSSNLLSETVATNNLKEMKKNPYYKSSSKRNLEEIELYHKLVLMNLEDFLSWMNKTFENKKIPKDEVLQTILKENHDEDQSFIMDDDVSSLTLSLRSTSLETVLKKINVFLGSHRFKITSHIFGTFICLLFIGMRLQILAETSNTLQSPSPNTKAFSILFWAEFTWLSFFIFISFCICLLSYNISTIYIASTFDIFLSAICMFVLIYSHTFQQYEYEGFTSIIAFRLFRFNIGDVLAHKIPIRNICRLCRITQQTPKIKESILNPTDQYNKKLIKTIHEQALHLWLSALSAFPDVVTKYGVFSSEMLKSMLGVSIDTEPSLFSNLSETAIIRIIQPSHKHHLSCSSLADLSQDTSNTTKTTKNNQNTFSSFPNERTNTSTRQNNDFWTWTNNR